MYRNVLVAPPFTPPVYSEIGVYSGAPFSPSEYRKLTEQAARKALDVVRRVALRGQAGCRTCGLDTAGGV